MILPLNRIGSRFLLEVKQALARASAVEFPVVLANLEAKLDALYGQFERLAAANERLTEMMLGRVADLEESDSVEVVEGQKKLGDYVR
jgi:hypothetical protein